MTTLSDLETLLEQAKEPSRYLDADIAHILCGVPISAWTGPCVIVDGNVSHDVPKYTSSIDAAVQLVEAVLPDRTWVRVHQGDILPAYVQIVRKSGAAPMTPRVNYRHEFHALALCLAVVKAKMAEEQS